MRQNLIVSIAAAAALLLAGSSSWAEEEMNPAAMAKALPASEPSPGKGTKVSEREGKPHFGQVRDRDTVPCNCPSTR